MSIREYITETGMTAREYIIQTVGYRTGEVPTADCPTIMWAVIATLDAAKEVMGPLYDFDTKLAEEYSK